MRLLATCVLLGGIAAAITLAAREHRERAPAAAAIDPFEGVCQAARAADCDVLVWWQRESGFLDDGDRDRAFEREVLRDDTRAAGFVVLAYRDAEERASVLPAPLQPLSWWVPLLGSSSFDDRTRTAPTPLGIDFARIGLHSQFVLLDAGGRPIEMLRDYRAGESRQFVDDVARLRAIRERRDAAFARARAATGIERAAELQAALQVLDRWIVVRCYADELAEAAANGDADVRAWAEPLLHESRVLAGCDAIGCACARELAAIDPRRLRGLLASATAEWQDVPEVLQLAECCQATVDARWAGDNDARAVIARRLEQTIELAPTTWVAQLAMLMRLDLEK